MLPSARKQRLQASRWQPRPGSGLNTTQIREWARAQSIEAKARDRVPAGLVTHVEAAPGHQG